MASSRPTLNRDRIIEACLRIVDDAGVEGLSMRKLGTELGVDAMAIYGYFDSKAELLAAVVEHVTVELLDLPAPLPDDATEILIRTALHYREVFLKHPNLAAHVIARPLSHVEAAAAISIGHELLRATGCPEERLVPATGILVRYTFGFVLHEALQTGLLGQMGIDRKAHAAGLQQALKEMGVGEPALLTAARQNDPEAAREEFELGLRTLLRGLKEE